MDCIKVQIDKTKLHKIILFALIFLSLYIYKKSINKDVRMRFMIKFVGSTSNNMPSSFFSFSTNAWPAVFLISHKIFSTFNISDDIGSLSLESSCTGSNSHFDISSTFYNQCLCTISSKNSRHLSFNCLLSLWLIKWIVRSE